MKTCLLVDDSRTIRKVARMMLEKEGFVCSEAENGQAGFDACMQAMPDFILLDWNMPVVTGIEFLSMLRAAPGGQTPVVMLCTTENDISFIQKALLAGANEYVMKPFDAEILHGKLAQLGFVEL